MNILFFVEPAVYRENPAFLSPHINNVRCFINANLADGVRYALATSPFLLSEYDHWLQHGGLKEIMRFSLSGREVLSPHGFDRAAYARDLYASTGKDNDYLVDQFQRIDRQFRPDLIIASTENRYLRTCFPSAKVAFYEAGPLPRRDGRTNMFFDFGGHGSTSVMAAHFDRIKALPVAEDVAINALDMFRTRFAARDGMEDSAISFRAWLKENAGGKKVAIIAHSPPDNVSIDGARHNLPTDALTCDILSHLPRGWLGVATYHRDMAFSPAMEHYLASDFPNFRLLPDALRHSGSDPFLPFIDAVITVASKTSLSAALFGKRSVSLGQSMLSGFSVSCVEDIDTAAALSDGDAGRLLCFLSNRYTLTFEECFEQNGAWLNFLRPFVKATDPVAMHFDISNWALSKIDYLAL